MRLMYDEQSAEHHLGRCNSAFHNHGTVTKRKMLGGVSFDSGAALGNSKSAGNTMQAGVNEAQPPFTNKYNENLSLSETGLRIGRAKGEADTAGIKENGSGTSKNASINASTAINNNSTINENAAIHAAEIHTAAAHNTFPALENFLDKIITHVIESDNLKISRSSFIRGLTLKLGKGINTLLERSNQDSKRQNRQKPDKKIPKGTRPITKEDVYEIQFNSSYLLESYNKNGERSTLGK